MDLKTVCDFFKARLHTKRDLIIAISGPKGEGKSTCSIDIGKEANQEKFSFAVNMIFNANKDVIVDKIVKLPFFSVIIIDEAIAAAYKRDWQDEINIGLNKAFARGRKFYKIVILNIPEFALLDRDIRNSWIDIWIDIPIRGRAVIMVRDKFKKKGDPWHLDFIDEMIDKHVKDNSDIEGYIRALKSLPRSMFIGEFYFHQLPIDEEEEYINMFQEKEKLGKEMKEGRSMRKLLDRQARLVRFMHDDLYLTLEDIANIGEFKHAVSVGELIERAERFPPLNQVLRKKVINKIINNNRVVDGVETENLPELKEMPSIYIEQPATSVDSQNIIEPIDEKMLVIKDADGD